MLASNHARIEYIIFRILPVSFLLLSCDIYFLCKIIDIKLFQTLYFGAFLVQLVKTKYILYLRIVFDYGSVVKLCQYNCYILN